MLAPSKLRPSVLLRVLPAAFLVLLGAWYVTSTMTARTVERQALSELKLSAAGLASELKTRLSNLQDTATALSANDLIRNGLIDTNERRAYLAPMFQSLRIAGPPGALVILTDYKGRHIASNGKRMSFEKSSWIAKVMSGQPHIQISSRGLIVVVPVNSEGSPEGMLIISYRGDQLAAALRVGDGRHTHIVLDASDQVLHSTNREFAPTATRFASAGRPGWLQLRATVLANPRLTLVVAVSEARALAPVRDVQIFALLANVLSLIVLAGGIVLATWLTTKPLAAFIASIRGITDAGDLEARIKPAGSAEFRELAQSFNQMIERLRNTTTSRDRVDNILNSMHEMLLVTDHAGTIELANLAAHETLDYIPGELIGLSIGEIFEDDDPLGPNDGSDRTATEAEFRARDGNLISVLVSTSNLDGGLDGWQVIYVALDITKKKKAELDLKNAQERLATAIESMPGTFVLFDADDRLVLCNSKYRNELHPFSSSIIEPGLRFEDLIRHSAEIGEYTGAKGRTEEFIEEALIRHRNPGEVFEVELPDGQCHQIQERRTADGSLVGVGTDITELKDREEKLHMQADALTQEIDLREKSETALRERELQLRTIFEVAEDGLVVIDETGTIENVNPAVEKIFGYDADRLVGSNVRMLMPEPDRSAHDGYIERHTSGGKPKVIGMNRELFGLRSDGTVFPIELTVSNIWVAGRQLFTGFIRDITERKEIENMKNEFISTVSHELRTPLTSIQGSLGLLRGGIVGELNDRARKIIEIAAKNSERLIRLINDILDSERIASGKLQLDPQPIQTTDLLEEAIAVNRAYAAQCHVGLVLDDDIPDLIIDGDRDRLLQVIGNFISNAAKFSPRHDCVVVTVKQLGDRAKISVLDRGPGIPEEFRSVIFGKFAQADGSDSRKKGGSGLGLNISKQIVELHGGTIGYESEVGSGSEFYFELPVVVDAGRGVAAPARSRDDANATEQRVLVCAYDSDTAALLATAMRQSSFSVDTAHNSQDARALLHQHSYVAMTLDLDLADINVAEFVRELRGDERTADLPIIVVSATADPDAGELNGDGFQIADWIEKPIDVHHLQRTVRRVVERMSNGRASILHVEDDLELRDLISVAAGNLGEIIGASTVNEAKRLLTKRVFDTIILDLMLPDGLGEGLLSYLSGTINRTTPVIVFSARDLSGKYRGAVKEALVKSNSTHDDLVAIVKTTIDDHTNAASNGPMHRTQVQ